MSPELETLDQLLGGELTLSVVRRLYPDDEDFAKAIHGLLISGDVKLFAGEEVPQWRWRKLFVEGAWKCEETPLTLVLTDAGAKRMG